MKICTNFMMLLFVCQFSLAQNFYLKATANDSFNKNALDSIGYINIHKDLKSLLDETKNISKKLVNLGYLENECINNQKINDSTFNLTYNLGIRTHYLYLYIQPDSELKIFGIIEKSKDTIKLPFFTTESYIKNILSKLEELGYPLSTVKLRDLELKKGKMNALLNIELNQKRLLNAIVIKGYDNFPIGHQKNIINRYKNKTFNQEIIKNIQQDFEKINFISLTKNPEILFTKDTTKIYVYIEKSKPNKFDGFIGFSNDNNNKISFRGYLDLLLVNAFNVGEKFSIYWRSDGGNQKTFNFETEFPYIFKSKFGIKTSLNIFKKDSLFQNTKTALDIGYLFNYNSRLYIGYQTAESSDIQKLNNSQISDYKNNFITTNYEYINNQKRELLFSDKTKVIAKFGFGSRNTNVSNNKQLFGNLECSHTFFLNQKNNINIRSQNYFLQSDQYITNELFRFGGIHSIRGFNENSLQGNVFSSILTEYRFVISQNLYIHSITDYGYFKDTLSKETNNLFGLGFGFGILTKNGFLNIIYANGNTKNQPIKFSNSLLHLSFLVDF